MSAPPSHHEHSALRFALALAVVFVVLVWPVILLRGQGTSEAFDQQKYHLPVIETMSAQWPRVDIIGYRSATTPGYHLALAVVHRYVTENVTILRLLGSLGGLAFVLAVWSTARRAAQGADAGRVAATLTLPLLASSHVIGGSIWLTTDNTALVFVALALGGAVTMAVTIRAVVRWNAFALLGVLVRQVHLWVVAPIAVAALLGSPRGRRGPLVATVLAATVPIGVLAGLAWQWGGLTPPAFAHVHDAGANPANLTLILALFGLFGVFFLPAMVERSRDLLPLDPPAAIACAVAVVISLVFATSYDHDAGRWGGAVWEVVRCLPAPGDRSIVLSLLAAIGALVLVRATRAGVAAGHGRGVVVLLVGILAWTAAQSVNSMAWQRYCEPPILMFLAWLTALAVGGERRPLTPRWCVGPLTLALLQLVVVGWKLYLPVLQKEG